jgi:hypothetical protein
MIFFKRPDWNKCADAVDGGVDRWKVLSQGKSSNQIVDILLNEFSGANQDTNTVKFFNGLVSIGSCHKSVKHLKRLLILL